MDGNTLDLSNRGLREINEIQGMLTQYAGGIQMLNLSGNYLKYVNNIINLKIFSIEISIYKYLFRIYNILY
jgi:hypothetical protein